MKFWRACKLAQRQPPFRESWQMYYPSVYSYQWAKYLFSSCEFQAFTFSKKKNSKLTEKWIFTTSWIIFSIVFFSKDKLAMLGRPMYEIEAELYLKSIFVFTWYCYWHSMIDVIYVWSNADTKPISFLQTIRFGYCEIYSIWLNEIWKYVTKEDQLNFDRNWISAFFSKIKSIISEQLCKKNRVRTRKL